MQNGPLYVVIEVVRWPRLFVHVMNASWLLCVGTITLLDGDKILWSLFVDHQLFALTKLDVTVCYLC